MTVVAVGAAAIPYFYRRVDDTIREKIETKLRHHYRGLNVRVRAAQLIPGEGIEIRGLSIQEPGKSGTGAELVHFEQVLLRCDTDLDGLIRGEIVVRRAVAHRPVARATRSGDGQWNLAKLFPLPSFGDRAPEWTIEDGSLEIVDNGKESPSRLVLREIHARLTPELLEGKKARQAGKTRVSGRARSDHLRRIDFEGIWRRSENVWSLSGKVDGLEACPELLRGLPCRPPEVLAPCESFRGQVRGEFRFDYDPRAERPSRYEFHGKLERGMLDDPRLPLPLTNAVAIFHVDQDGTRFEEIKATAGKTELRAEGAIRGHGPAADFEFDLEVKGLKLDRELADSLPDTFRRHWNKFLPDGEIDLNAHLARVGGVWSRGARVALQGVSFVYHKFPYRLDHGQGTIRFSDEAVTYQLRAFAGRAELRLEGESGVVEPRLGDFVEVRGDAIPIDEKLIQALPDRSREVVRSLNPQGSIDVDMRMERQKDEQGAAIWRKDLSIELLRCSIRFDGFGYPLQNVRGRAVMRDDTWEFSRLEGTNDTALVTCSGRLDPTPNGNQLELAFRGVDVPLEEELRDALNPGAQRLWNDLKPRGSVNFEAKVTRLGPGGKPNVTVWATPVEDPDHPTSIEPTRFPYRLDALRGNFEFHDGRVELHDLYARHGRVETRAEGFCEVDPEGGWRLRLENLAIDRLRADRDLLQALPERLRKTISGLRPSGAVRLTGVFELRSTGEPESPMSSAWDLDFDFLQGGLYFGIELENLEGGFHLTGKFDGRNFRSSGELEFDSLVFHDLQFTNLRGPFWLDDTSALFGAPAERQRGATTQRRVSCDWFGGQVQADAHVRLGPTPSYAISAEIDRADLGRYVHEAVEGRQYMEGKVSASLRLEGQGSGLRNLRGAGEIQLDQAQLLELPVAVALLSTLSGKAPEARAFEASQMSFHVEGEHVYLSPIRLTGNAISLVGEGEVSLDKKVSLDFYSTVGRNDVHIPIWSDLMGGASQQFLLIKVRGSLDEPKVEKQVLPAVNEALKRLQGDGASPPERVADRFSSVPNARSPRGRNR